MKSVLPVWTAVLLVSFASVGQDYPESTVECEGTAQVAVEPDYVEFVFRKVVRGASNAEAVKEALGFEAALTKHLSEQELPTAHFTPSETYIKDFRNREAGIVIGVRFDVARLRAEEQPNVRFGALCDGMVAAAEALGCGVRGPRLAVNEPLSFEQTAIGKAIENAYYPAEASAFVLQSRVIAVTNVDVVEVSWDGGKGTVGKEVSSVLRIYCSAKVKVEYGVVASE